MEDSVGRQREEYERFFLAELRRLLDPVGPVEGWSKEKGYAEMRRGETCAWKGVGVEEIYLDVSAPQHEVVVLLRDLSRPECLFGWRAPAIQPSVFESDLYVFGTVEETAQTHAMVMSANLEEASDLTNFLRRRDCSPGSIAWI